MTELRATYRLQLGPRLRLRGGRARSCPTCATSASRTSTCRRRFRRARGRRTATTSSTRLDLARARRRGGVRALSRPCASAGWASCSTSCPTTWRPTTRTASGATATLREQFFDIDAVTGRHRRFFDVDHLAARAPGGPRGLRGDARAGAAAGARGRGRRAADRSSGRARRPRAATWQRLRDGGAEHVWVEKILDPGEQLRDWPVDGTVGYEFLNDVAALFVDPAGEAPLTDLWVEISGDDRRFAELRLRGQARAGADDVRARGRAAAARRAAARRRARARAGVVPGLPHLRRAVVGPRRATPTARRSPRPACRPRWRACSRSRRPAGTRSSRASSRRRRR